VDLTALCLGISSVGPPPMTIQEAAGQAPIQNVGMVTSYRARAQRVSGGLCAVCKLPVSSYQGA
jgi:hypothetical protein